jgi:hypothetical protein
MPYETSAPPDIDLQDIDITAPEELQRWAEILECEEEELRRLVSLYGTSVGRIRCALAGLEF